MTPGGRGGRRGDMIAGGAYQLVCDGVSELVREQEAVYLSTLDQLRARRFAQLDLKLEQSAQSAAHKAHREERARRDIDEVFKDYLEWVQETMSTERTPWLKVICAMVGNSTEAVMNSATPASSRDVGSGSS